MVGVLGIIPGSPGRTRSVLILNSLDFIIPCFLKIARRVLSLHLNPN